ncbi:MAG TPA: DinB family protein [Candidatus Dormibacteraeota bacterium]|nr:DinB family protein [Candidatus Dormibacteraeota bacterium]
MAPTDRIDALLRMVSGIPDADLLRSWAWRGTEVNVRHGLYRMLEIFEEGAEQARNRSRGSRLRDQSEAGRWDLHAVMLPLAESDLDADPGEEQWTIRKTLRHTLGAQDWFGRVLNDSVRLLAADAPVPLDMPDQILADFGPRPPYAKGTIPEILALFDTLMDRALTAVDELEVMGKLDVPINWFGAPVTQGYFAHRQSAHLREHTIQIDKTLQLLGRTPTEAQRIARAQARAFAGMLCAPAATVADKLGEAESVAAELAQRVGGVDGPG